MSQAGGQAGGQDALRSISCTQCAAPLELHGGHKVRSITCGYCGSVMDTRESFKVVKQFKDLARPRAPVRIGMRGKLSGVEFTVIGVVQWRTVGYGDSWLEFMLFSPTHGYAWLEHARGHFVFTRRVRDVPRIPHERKARFKAMGEEFRVFERYKARIVFVEGELTWVASVGDTTTIIEGVAPPRIFAAERTEGEEEYLIGEYLEPGEVYEAFGLSGEPRRPIDIHPAQPFRPNPLFQGASRAAKVFAPLSLLILIAILVTGSGSVRTRGAVSPPQLTQGFETEPFKVEDADSLVALDLRSGLSNAWGYFDIALRRAGEDVFAIAKQIAYYHGREGGESWSEGSQDARAYFRVPAAGDYTLYFTGEGARGNRSGGTPVASLSYEVREGVVVSRYFLVLTIAFAAALALPWINRARFEHKRWEDDDDDD